MTHTPAPWTLNPARSTRVDLIDNAKGHAIGEIVWVDVRNPADARLIVLSPVLLDLCKRALGAIDEDSYPQLRDDLRQGIDQAEGKP